MLATGM